LHSFIPNISQNVLRNERKLSSEALLANIIPFAGSGFLGYAMGFALKKVLKWMLIIIGFLAQTPVEVPKSGSFVFSLLVEGMREPNSFIPPMDKL